LAKPVSKPKGLISSDFRSSFYWFFDSSSMPCSSFESVWMPEENLFGIDEID
jgi:hypothetical protein